MSTIDDTEVIRCQMLAKINTEPGERAVLEREHGQIWDTDELCRDFEVEGFLAPMVVVRRKSDGKTGSMLFQHHPRYYWGFQAEG